MTVLEAIQRSSDYLAGKGVESPRLNAELLLAHVLDMQRMKLYLNFEQVLSEQSVETLRNLVVRRGKREPLQQVIGLACFCGLDFAVNRSVLTPRPETELLAEQGWKILQKLVATGAPLGKTENPADVLDFGTGSGCLAVATAAKFPALKVMALDLSADALALARTNAERHQVAKRITFLQSDGFGALQQSARFFLVLANPPYIPKQEIETLQPEVRDFEPRLALDGGVDGLDFYRRLASEAGDYLHPGGWMVLEFGEGQAPAISNLFAEQNWIVEPPIDDYTGRARILVVQKGPNRTT